MDKRFFVYIMTSRPLGPLYVGVTSNLVARVFQHKQGEAPGFTLGKREWKAFMDKWFSQVPGMKALQAAAKDYKAAIASGELRIENPNPKPYGGPF